MDVMRYQDTIRPTWNYSQTTCLSVLTSPFFQLQYHYSHNYILTIIFLLLLLNRNYKILLLLTRLIYHYKHLIAHPVSGNHNI